MNEETQENKENQEDIQQETKVDWSTQWPTTIGRKDKPNDDGKIRDCWGNVMG